MLKWRPACKAVLSEAFVTGGEALGEKYGGAAACKAVPRHQLRHNKVLSFRQLLYCLRPGTVSRVTTAPLSIALQAIPLTRQVTTASLGIAICGMWKHASPRPRTNTVTRPSTNMIHAKRKTAAPPLRFFTAKIRLFIRFAKFLMQKIHTSSLFHEYSTSS